MKKFLLVIAAIVFCGSFITPKSAEAVFYPISDIDFNNSTIFGPTQFSPQSNQVGIPITAVKANQWGSVSFGGGESASYAQGNTNQPIGIYGAGVPLAPLAAIVGYTPYGYNVEFDVKFKTYDSSSYDRFMAVITKGNYYWAGGEVMGLYSWGGLNETGLEYYNDVNTITHLTTLVTPGSDYYLNCILETTSDQQYPSWGRFSHFGVEPIVPEPATLSLLGFGLLGLAGRKIRRTKQEGR
jgi:hypothetical protein